MGREGSGRGRVRRRRWLGAGVVLVVAVLFHDLAMTADAHVAVSGPAAESGHTGHAAHAPVPAHAPGIPAVGVYEAPGEGCDGDPCHPPDDCGVGLSGVLGSGGNRVSLALDLPVGSLDAATVGRRRLVPLETADPPPLAAGVRRALFQVFIV